MRWGIMLRKPGGGQASDPARNLSDDARVRKSDDARKRTYFEPMSKRDTKLMRPQCLNFAQDLHLKMNCARAHRMCAWKEARAEGARLSAP